MQMFFSCLELDAVNIRGQTAMEVAINRYKYKLFSEIWYRAQFFSSFLGQIFIPKNVYLKFLDENHQSRTMIQETDLKRQKNNGKTFLYVFSCFYKFKKDQFRISIKIWIVLKKSPYNCGKNRTSNKDEG